MPGTENPCLVIRTITAGINLDPTESFEPLVGAITFLTAARRRFEGAGHVVQSTRIATQPQSSLFETQTRLDSLRALQELDSQAKQAGQIVSIGPLIEAQGSHDGFADWAAELVERTDHLFFSVTIVSPPDSIHRSAIAAAAEAMLAISRVGRNGEANFRFGAAARVPASTPFFPVAYHWGPAGFAIGLEAAGLVGEAFSGASHPETAAGLLQRHLEQQLAPLQDLAREISAELGWPFHGFDLSPAPSLEASIAGPIESLIAQPFGSPSTLVACAAITRALDTTQLTKCGYSGLMLPVLEDRILARRACEGRFGIHDLLLYSSVCGTGLDVIPIPGDTGVEDLSRLLLDVAALSAKLRKPLAARLLPMPGSVVLPLD
jgi:uncharacterized protein (UPF0210 family)